MVTRGGGGFSFLIKYKKKEENYADFYVAGKRIFFSIYDVIMKQNIKKRFTYVYLQRVVACPFGAARGQDRLAAAPRKPTRTLLQ